MRCLRMLCVVPFLAWGSGETDEKNYRYENQPSTIIWDYISNELDKKMLDECEQADHLRSVHQALNRQKIDGGVSKTKAEFNVSSERESNKPNKPNPKKAFAKPKTGKSFLGEIRDRRSNLPKNKRVKKPTPLTSFNKFDRSFLRRLKEDKRFESLLQKMEDQEADLDVSAFFEEASCIFSAKELFHIQCLLYAAATKIPAFQNKSVEMKPTPSTPKLSDDQHLRLLNLTQKKKVIEGKANRLARIIQIIHDLDQIYLSQIIDLLKQEKDLLPDDLCRSINFMVKRVKAGTAKHETDKNELPVNQHPLYGVISGVVENYMENDKKPFDLILSGLKTLSSQYRSEIDHDQKKMMCLIDVGDMLKKLKNHYCYCDVDQIVFEYGKNTCALGDHLMDVCQKLMNRPADLKSDVARLFRVFEFNYRAKIVHECMRNCIAIEQNKYFSRAEKIEAMCEVMDFCRPNTSDLKRKISEYLYQDNQDDQDDWSINTDVWQHPDLFIQAVNRYNDELCGLIITEKNKRLTKDLWQSVFERDKADQKIRHNIDLMRVVQDSPLMNHVKAYVEKQVNVGDDKIAFMDYCKKHSVDLSDLLLKAETMKEFLSHVLKKLYDKQTAYNKGIFIISNGIDMLRPKVDFVVPDMDMSGQMINPHLTDSLLADRLKTAVPATSDECLLFHNLVRYVRYKDCRVIDPNFTFPANLNIAPNETKDEYYNRLLKWLQVNISGAFDKLSSEETDLWSSICE